MTDQNDDITKKECNGIIDTTLDHFEKELENFQLESLEAIKHHESNTDSSKQVLANQQLNQYYELLITNAKKMFIDLRCQLGSHIEPVVNEAFEKQKVIYEKKAEDWLLKQLAHEFSQIKVKIRQEHESLRKDLLFKTKESIKDRATTLKDEYYKQVTSLKKLAIVRIEHDLKEFEDNSLTELQQELSQSLSDQRAQYRREEDELLGVLDSQKQNLLASERERLQQNLHSNLLLELTEQEERKQSKLLKVAEENATLKEDFENAYEQQRLARAQLYQEKEDYINKNLNSSLLAVQKQYLQSKLLNTISNEKNDFLNRLKKVAADEKEQIRALGEKLESEQKDTIAAQHNTLLEREKATIHQQTLTYTELLQNKLDQKIEIAARTEKLQSNKRIQKAMIKLIAAANDREATRLSDEKNNSRQRLQDQLSKENQFVKDKLQNDLKHERQNAQATLLQQISEERQKSLERLKDFKKMAAYEKAKRDKHYQSTNSRLTKSRIEQTLRQEKAIAQDRLLDAVKNEIHNWNKDSSTLARQEEVDAQSRLAAALADEEATSKIRLQQAHEQLTSELNKLRENHQLSLDTEIANSRESWVTKESKIIKYRQDELTEKYEELFAEELETSKLALKTESDMRLESAIKQEEAEFRHKKAGITETVNQRLEDHRSFLQKQNDAEISQFLEKIDSETSSFSEQQEEYFQSQREMLDDEYSVLLKNQINIEVENHQEKKKQQLEEDLKIYESDLNNNLKDEIEHLSQKKKLETDKDFSQQLDKNKQDADQQHKTSLESHLKNLDIELKEYRNTLLEERNQKLEEYKSELLINEKEQIDIERQRLINSIDDQEKAALLKEQNQLKQLTQDRLATTIAQMKKSKEEEFQNNLLERRKDLEKIAETDLTKELDRVKNDIENKLLGKAASLNISQIEYCAQVIETVKLDLYEAFTKSIQDQIEHFFSNKRLFESKPKPTSTNDKLLKLSPIDDSTDETVTELNISPSEISPLTQPSTTDRLNAVSIHIDTAIAPDILTDHHFDDELEDEIGIEPNEVESEKIKIFK